MTNVHKQGLAVVISNQPNQQYLDKIPQIEKWTKC